MKNLKSKKSSDSIHQDEILGQPRDAQNSTPTPKKVQCVFVHGWAMNSGVWQSFIEKLPAYIEPICIDLAGHGEFNHTSFSSLDELAEHCMAVATKQLSGPAVWVGWSLAGLPLLRLARLYPEHFKKLLLIASNPCFVNQADWHNGVEVEVFDLFAENLMLDTEKTIQRFMSLQVQGMVAPRETLRQLRQAVVSRGLPSEAALNTGLTLLKESDLREELAQLSIPQYWLLGEKDSLVPASLNNFLKQISTVKSHIISGSAHLPFVSHADDVMQHLLDCIND